LLPVLSLSPGTNDFDSWLRDLYRFLEGVSPITSLCSLLPFHPESFASRAWGRKEDWEMPTAGLGLAFWALAGLLPWGLLLYRFGQVTTRRPPGTAPPEPAASPDRNLAAVEV